MSEYFWYSFLFSLIHLKSQVQPCWLVKTFSASPHEDLGHYSPGAEARYSTPIIKHSCRFLNIANVCFIVVVNLSHLHNFRPQVGFSSLVQKAVECTGRHRCCSWLRCWGSDFDKCQVEVKGGVWDLLQPSPRRRRPWGHLGWFQVQVPFSVPVSKTAQPARQLPKLPAQSHKSLQAVCWQQLFPPVQFSEQPVPPSHIGGPVAAPVKLQRNLQPVHLFGAATSVVWGPIQWGHLGGIQQERPERVELPRRIWEWSRMVWCSHPAQFAALERGTSFVSAAYLWASKHRQHAVLAWQLWLHLQVSAST